MPQLPHTRTVIELPVSSIEVGNTLVRQKARFQNLFHEQGADGQSFVIIKVLVIPYAAVDGGDGFGPQLTSSAFKSYDRTLSADNRSIVDVRPEYAGDVLATRTLGQTDESWQAVLDSFEQPFMLQGDFFELLRDTQPVAIGELIRKHIQRADELGRFS